MDILKYKDYEGTAELDMSRGVCRGKILFINDLVTYEAASPAELQKEFEVAVDDYLETCQQVGKEPQRPFRGAFNVRVSPALHRAAAIRSVADCISLNETVVRALDAYLGVCTVVNHNVRVSFEPFDDQPKTVTAVASGDPRWETTNVH